MVTVYVDKLLLTKGFVQLGLDVEAIIGSVYPGFGFGGRNSFCPCWCATKKARRGLVSRPTA
jgi:hypothetical protein